MKKRSLRRFRRGLVTLVIVYFFAGSASQKLVPGVDEIFPFFGWSLFSLVPNVESTYTVVIHEHGGKAVVPAAAFLKAPDSIVRGNRYIARKVIQKLGRAQDRGREEEARRLRSLLEENYFNGRVRYEVLFERYNPLEKWRSGVSLEQRSVVHFEGGGEG